METSSGVKSLKTKILLRQLIILSKRYYISYFSDFQWSKKKKRNVKKLQKYFSLYLK